MPRRKETFTCELCGKPAGDEFGDVGGAAVCAVCMGWTGKEPDPEVTRFLEDAVQRGDAGY
jgi:hypothetical protein